MRCLKQVSLPELEGLLSLLMCQRLPYGIDTKAGERLGDEDAQVRFAYSPKGWTDDVLGLDYLENHFYPLVMSIIDPNYPIFFILDGHASLFSFYFVYSMVC